MIRTSIFVILFVTTPATFAQGSKPLWQSQPQGDIIAIGDIHGDADALLEILHNTNVLNRKGEITGRTVDLVLGGDYVDRGDDSLEVLSIIKNLKEQETETFKVWINLGNHDIQLISGHLHYLSRKDIALLARRWSGKTNTVMDDNARSMQQSTHIFLQRYNVPLPNAKLLMDAYRGLVEMIAEPGSVFEFLANNATAFVKLGDSGFVHAGIEPKHVKKGMEHYNTLLRSELQKQITQFRQMRDGTLKGRPKELSEEFSAPNSMMWTRNVAKETYFPHEFEAMLGGLGIKRLVVGHTPTSDNTIQRLYDGALIKTDTSISSVYSGNLTALRIRSGNAEQLGPFRRRLNNALRRGFERDLFQNIPYTAERIQSFLTQCRRRNK